MLTQFLKSLLLLSIMVLSVFSSCAQDSTVVLKPYPENIIKLGNVENLGELHKGKSIEFSFPTGFNKQVVLDVYNETGGIQSTNTIEVYSKKGLAMTTRSFSPGIYFFHLQLSGGNQIKRVVIIE